MSVDQNESMISIWHLTVYNRNGIAAGVILRKSIDWQDRCNTRYTEFQVLLRMLCFVGCEPHFKREHIWGVSTNAASVACPCGVAGARFWVEISRSECFYNVVLFVCEPKFYSRHTVCRTFTGIHRAAIKGSSCIRNFPVSEGAAMHLYVSTLGNAWKKKKSGKVILFPLLE